MKSKLREILGLLLRRNNALNDKISMVLIADAIGADTIENMKLDLQVMLDLLSTIKPTGKPIALEDI